MATFREALGKTAQALPQMIQMWHTMAMDAQKMELEERKTTSAEKTATAQIAASEASTEMSQENLADFKRRAPYVLRNLQATEELNNLNLSIKRQDEKEYPEVLRRARELADANIQALHDESAQSLSAITYNNLLADAMRNKIVSDSISFLDLMTKRGNTEAASKIFEANGGDFKKTVEDMMEQGIFSTPEERAIATAGIETWGVTYSAMLTDTRSAADMVAYKLSLGKGKKDDNGVEGMDYISLPGANGEPVQYDYGMFTTGGGRKIFIETTMDDMSSVDDFINKMRGEINKPQLSMPSNTEKGDNKGVKVSEVYNYLRTTRDFKSGLPGFYAKHAMNTIGLLAYPLNIYTRGVEQTLGFGADILFGKEKE